jgi:hypothetical protein
MLFLLRQSVPRISIAHRIHVGHKGNMRGRLLNRVPVVAGFFVCFLLQSPHRSAGQICRGDLDGDGQVTAADLQIVVAIVAGEPESDLDRKARADVNSDGVVSAADIVLDIHLQGGGCEPVPPTASPTRTPTPSATPGSSSPTKSPVATSTPSRTASRTNAVTQTATPTRPPTPTATPTCVVVAAQFGTTNGALTADDCQRVVGGRLRHVDVYTITGTLGQAITVQVTPGPTPGPSPIVPYVVVIDPDGQFYQAQGSPPLQFVVSSAQPYQIVVASAPSAAQELGPYQLTLTQTPCPATVVLTIPQTKTATLKTTDCPDPGWPSTGTYLNPAHIYTFQVLSVPTTIDIQMKQLSVNDDIYPAFSVLTPDRIELVTQDNNWDCTPDTSDLICSEARFLALQTGQYTIIAAGGTGRYSLQITSPSCKATALSNIPSTPPPLCSTQSVPGCVVGSLSANPSVTRCAAPLPIPGISEDAPADPNSPADLYALTAAAGDVISATMISDDDAHLYLLGPGNQLVAQDDDSLGSDAQLAATVVQAGTYTIVAANNYGLYPDDDPIAYTLQVQKCPVRGVLSPSSAGVTRADAFSGTDCVGFDDIPYRTYSFTGTAGQLVTVAMTSDDVDAFVRVLAADGSVVQNDDDLLAHNSTDAQVFRVLPAAGSYFIEATASAGIDLTSSSAFALRAQICPPTPVLPGSGTPTTIQGSFDDTDCQATDGTRFDTFVFTPAVVPSGASLLAPDNGCLTALLAEGTQTPDNGCSSGALDIPLLSQRSYGFIVSADNPDSREPYTVRLSSCPLSVVTYGDTRAGSIIGGDCEAADGTPSEWSWFRGGATLVHFNFGFSGSLTAAFPARVVLSDLDGSTQVGPSVRGDDTSMYAVPPDLGALLRVGGQTPADQGQYTLSFGPASYRQ